MDKNFEDLLEGCDYTTTQLKDNLTGKFLKGLKQSGGLALMMFDIIVIEKGLGHKYDPDWDAPHRDFEYNPSGANPNSPYYPYQKQPTPRKWAK